MCGWCSCVCLNIFTDFERVCGWWVRYLGKGMCGCICGLAQMYMCVCI